MTRSHAGYARVPFTRARRAAQDLAVIQRTHLISGLIAADVTDAHAYMREYAAATGVPLSFTAFIAGCVARAVDENKLVQAYRRGRRWLVVFDDVDVTVLIEHAGSSPDVPSEVAFHIVRAANRKSLLQIHDEIRAAQSAARSHERQPITVRLYDALPSPIRRLLIRLGARSPVLWKQFGGTVAVTAVGMLGKGGGWGIPITCNTLDVTVGGIEERPLLIDGQLMSHEYLDLTISADHDVVDGAPVARFASRLRELVESAYGIRQLVDSLPSVESDPEAAEPTAPEANARDSVEVW